jgi:WD40 repeat protein
VASAGEDGTVRVWRLADGAASQIVHDGGKPERDVSFSPDGERILAVGDDGQVRFWRTGSGAEVRTVSGGGRELNAASFSPDGRRFAAGGRDGVTRIWSVVGGPPVAVLRGQTARVYDVGFAPAGDQVLSAGDDGTVRIWDAGRTQTFKVPSLTHGIDFNRDGRRIASSSDDGTVRVWDTSTGLLLDELPGPGKFMTAKFSPTSDMLAIASNAARDVRVWPVSAESAETVVELPAGRMSMSARFDPSGRRIVYSDTKSAIVVLDLESGREVTLRDGLRPVYDAHFSPDGARVAAIGEKPQVHIWRVDRPDRPEQVLEGHRGNIATLDFSQDGRVATAGSDHTVRITDPSDESAVVLQGHTDEVHTATFTPDGTRVLSASPDGTLRLWDSRTGVLLAVLQSGQALYDVAVSDAGTIATLGLGEIVRVFRCEVCGSLDQVRALAASRGPRPLTAEERRVFLASAE